MKEPLDNLLELKRKKIERLKEKRQPKIGWVSIGTPEEIFLAAGVIPFRITGESASQRTDASALLGNNYCSYVLDCLSEGIAGVYDFADGIVFVDACDMRKRLYDVWTNKLPLKNDFFLELPKVINPVTREYFRSQLHGLKESLEKQFSCKISDRSLREAIALTNRSRELLQRLDRICQKGSSPLKANQFIDIVKACAGGLKEEFNRGLAHLLQELDKLPASPPPKNHRVLLCGSYFDNLGILETIEKTGASLVVQDTSNGIKYFRGRIDTDRDPITAIADYYLEKSTCARNIDSDRRCDHLLGLVDEYRVESTIYFSLKFCDTNLMDYPYIRSRLMQKGIPVLHIEAEQHVENIENIKTRIQTFLETQMS